jgi:subtilase family serine protease
MTGRSWFARIRKASSLLRPTRSAKSRPSFRPRLEALEEMVLPSAVTMQPSHLLASHPIKHLASGSTPSGLSPAQIEQAYGLNQITFSNGTVKGTGAGETIAIVDAYDDPSIASDLTTFDRQYGLAAPPSFVKVGINSTGQGSTSKFPIANSGWAGEIELDVEWAHAIAPGANILLVEANSSSLTDLLNGVNYARNASGVVAVSMSWGSSEFSGESSYDSYFTTPSGHAGVTFFGSSGDSGSPSIWPALSTHVVGVGGSTLSTDSAGDYLAESGWSGSGGSLSRYLSQPSYQSGLTIYNGNVTISAGGKRAGPDVSYDSDPNTGFAVYGTYGWGGWAQVGGTSDAAPQWAALMAITDQGRALAGQASLDGYTQTLPDLYKLPRSDFHSITSGNNGAYSNGPGYNLVTGLGTPIANLVVGGLVGGSSGNNNGNPPTITTAAHVVSQTTTSASLSVAATDAAGASTLVYVWSVVSGPGSVSFSANDTNAAQNATATFSQAGTYTLLVTVVDPSNLTATSQVTVTTNQVLTSISVTPGSVNIAPNATQQFTATGLDQFGNPMSTQPSITWSLSATGVGTISSTGLFTASSASSGSVTVQASSGNLTGKASVTISSSGAVLFSDNFSSGSAPNWTVTSGYGDYAMVYDYNYGSYRIQDYNNGFAIDRVVAGQSTWTNYSYQATLNIGQYSSGSASLLARVQDNSHLYFFGYNIPLGEWMIAKKSGTTTTILATSAPATVYANTDYTVTANVNGTSLSLYVDGTLEASTTDSSYTSGKIGFSATNAVAELGNVVVTSLGGAQAIGHTAAVSAAQTTSWSGLYSSLLSLLLNLEQHHGLFAQ